MYIYYQGSDGSINCLGDNELEHYNHNHDALGRFARSLSGGITTKNSTKVQKEKLQKWKTKESAKIDKKYDRKIARKDKAAEKQADTFVEKATDRSMFNYTDKKLKANQQRAMKQIEKSFVQKASYQDMKKEKAYVRRSMEGYAFVDAAAIGLVSTGVIPIGILAANTPGRIKSNRRLKDSGEQIYNESIKMTNKDLEKLLKKRLKSQGLGDVKVRVTS